MTHADLEPWRSDDGMFGGKDDAGDRIEPGEGVGELGLEGWDGADVGE